MSQFILSTVMRLLNYLQGCYLFICLFFCYCEQYSYELGHASQCAEEEFLQTVGLYRDMVIQYAYVQHYHVKHNYFSTLVLAFTPLPAVYGCKFNFSQQGSPV